MGATLGRGCHVASYEGLKEDFPSQVRAIACVLGVTLVDDEIERLRDETSMDSLREKYSEKPLYQGENFFRKGVVGDWENHFDQATLRDIDKVLTHGIGEFDRHHLAYRFRRWLGWQLSKSKALCT